VAADSNTLVEYLALHGELFKTSVLCAKEVERVKEVLKSPVLRGDLPPSLNHFGEVSAHVWAEANFRKCIVSLMSGMLVYEPVREVVIIFKPPTVNQMLVGYIDWLQKRDENMTAEILPFPARA
jgi:hypothetical protein